MRLLLFSLLAICVSLVFGQDYAEYARQRQTRGRKGGNGGAIVVSLVSGVAGSFFGGWLQQGRMKKRHDKEKKDLLKYIQRYVTTCTFIVT